jgi:hypothetical protein
LDPAHRSTIDALITELRKEPCVTCGGQPDFHTGCGGGERLVDVLEGLVKRNDDKLLSCLFALARSSVPSRTDPVEIITTAFQSVAAKDPQKMVEIHVVSMFAEIMRRTAGQHPDVGSSRPHLLEFVPALPTYSAIDALLEIEPPHWETIGELRDRLVRRFGDVWKYDGMARRLTYLRGRLDQLAGDCTAAADRFHSIRSSRRITPNRFRIGSINYGGGFQRDTWYRVTLVVNHTAGSIASYIDGRLVQTLEVSGRFVNTFPLMSTALLFADNDKDFSSGSVGSVQLRNYIMTPAQIAALGGPTADGIPSPYAAAESYRHLLESFDNEPFVGYSRERDNHKAHKEHKDLQAKS